MKTLQIEESKVRMIYKNASYELKMILEDTFGKEFFSQKVTERIKTYEDACSELCIKPIDENALLAIGFTKDEVAYRKIKTITEALNEGWEPNYHDDDDEKKFIPSFMLDLYSGLVYSDINFCYLTIDMSTRLHLCFKSEELAIYAGKQFVEIYKDFLL